MSTTIDFGKTRKMSACGRKRGNSPGRGGKRGGSPGRGGKRGGAPGRGGRGEPPLRAACRICRDMENRIVYHDEHHCPNRREWYRNNPNTQYRR